MRVSEAKEARFKPLESQALARLRHESQDQPVSLVTNSICDGELFVFSSIRIPDSPFSNLIYQVLVIRDSRGAIFGPKRFGML